jgi:hypothetical protein
MDDDAKTLRKMLLDVADVLEDNGYVEDREDHFWDIVWVIDGFLGTRGETLAGTAAQLRAMANRLDGAP